MIKSIIANIFAFLLSIMILFIYQMYINNFEILSINKMIANNYVILMYILAIATISQYFYENDLSYKQRARGKFSLNVFKFISKYIHLSSIIIVVNSILIDNFLNLEFHNNLSFRFLGISFSTIAITIFVSSKISLGNNYSPCYDNRVPKFINKTGLYKYVRHPMYSSNILLLIGTLMISGSYLMFINIILLSSFYIIAAYREEKYLINKFSSYSQYSKKTGMFVPKYWK